MIHRGLPLVAIGILLSGCAANPGVYAGMAAQAPPPIGYHYHDSTHPNDVAQTSPQAMYNAAHGTWLWPPDTFGLRN
jgi:hypothetical protein